ncbi:serine hydrolase domain-containing protein [Streptomyces yangpuensis]|uniref:serine hydrolase domain-containing protein n=1 Tax=Streptomyces yangpuensis TaxID=1648182 RepID=UPI003825EABF
MTFSPAHWQSRLDALRAAHHVPGAVLAVFADGRIHELASGLLHRGTGVEATTDSVFQLGSMAKIYTATLVMQLVDSGRLDLDTPVAAILPEFSPAGGARGADKEITVRRLLSHTSGLTGDFTHDSGRGDDCLAAYVRAARNVALDCPPGTAVSYSSVGYGLLGRIVEVVTGRTWDQALKERIVAPLGLTRTMTLPEEALAFRTAMGHVPGEGPDPEPAPAWDMMPRSAGPHGRVLAGAADVLRLAKMHLDGGATADGTQVLGARAVAAMQRWEVDVPDRWTVSADGWGLGWSLYDWNGVPGYGHDGSALGQYSYLRVVPGADVIVVLLTNGGGARHLYADLFRELLADLAEVRMPPPFAPPVRPPAVDMTPLLGTYRREGVVITVTAPDGVPHLRHEFVDGMRDFSPPLETDLVPLSATVFAAAGAAGTSFGETWTPVVFAALVDGTPCCYLNMRCAPRTTPR